MESNPMLVDVWLIKDELGREATEVAALKFGRDVIVESGKT